MTKIRILMYLERGGPLHVWTDDEKGERVDIVLVQEPLDPGDDEEEEVTLPGFWKTTMLPSVIVTPPQYGYHPVSCAGDPYDKEEFERRWSQVKSMIPTWMGGTPEGDEFWEKRK